MPCAPGMPGAGVVRSSRARGTFSAARRSASEGWVSSWLVGRHRPDAARSAPRPGHAGWPASHPPPAGPGARAVPWPLRRRTSWMRIRAGHAPAEQVAIRASDAHATPQTRADSASAWYSHSRAKSRLAARKRGTCQFMKSRSGALAKPLRRASCRAASCHCSRAKYTAGIASVRPAMCAHSCARMARQASADSSSSSGSLSHSTLRVPPQSRRCCRMLALHSLFQVDRVQHRARHLGAHPFDLAEQRASASVRAGRLPGRVGVTRRAGAASPSPRQAGAGPAPRRPRPARRAAPHSHSGAVPSASPAPASAASPSSSRDDSFHPDRPGRAMPTARPAGGRSSALMPPRPM